MSAADSHRLLAALTGAWTLLWLLAVLWPAHRRPARVVALTTSGVLALLVLLLPPDTLPIGWITPQQEADTELLARIARGEGSHAGPLWTRLIQPWATGSVHRLDAVVLAGLAAAAASVPLGLAALPSDVRRAAVWLIPGLAVSPMLRFAAWSEGPATWIWLGIVMCALAAPLGRLGAVTATLGVGGLALLRTELILLVPAAVLARRAVSWRPSVRTLVAGVVVWGALAGAFTPAILGGRGAVAWMVQALHPLDPSPLLLVLVLLGAGGVGWAGLVGSGLREVGAQPGAWFAAVSLVGLFRLQYAAAHGPLIGRPGSVAMLEVVRYLGYTAPLAVALAAFGATGLPARLRPLLLFAGVAVPSALTLWPRSTWHEAPGFGTFGGLSADAQDEVRMLVTAMREEPTCGWAVPFRNGSATAWWVWGAVRSERSEARTLRVDGTLHDALAQLPADLPCVRGWIGMTWSRADGTASPLDGLPVRWEALRPPAPYAHADHGWTTADTVRRAVVDLSP